MGDLYNELMRAKRQEECNKPLTAKLGDFDIKRATKKKEDTMPEQAANQVMEQTQNVMVKGDADDVRLYISLPLSFGGLKCQPHLDMANRILKLVFFPRDSKEKGRIVTKPTQTNSTIAPLTFAPSWYTDHFVIPWQSAKVEGNTITLKINPPKEPALKKKGALANNPPANQHIPMEPNQSELSSEEAKAKARECIKYLNAYVKENPNAFTFEVINNQLKVNVVVRETLE